MYVFSCTAGSVGSEDISFACCASSMMSQSRDTEKEETSAAAENAEVKNVGKKRVWGVISFSILTVGDED